ncbi:MAG: type III-B CRISPR module RAMP protein Cmr1 [Nitrospirae bacterium]|nr:type III-B CRISPR module RAMP protein Cmr1 [Candidatus Troglogloeales bacterium]
MQTLSATFKIVTPMFIGGADQSPSDGIRPPSVKGALRFWYRAIDPDYKKHEARIFGGSGKDDGQAIFLLTLDRVITETKHWDKERYECLNEDHPNKPKDLSTNNKSWTLNGNTYLGFSLTMGDNKRTAILSNKTFTIKLLFKRQPDEQDQKRILAALWLFGHIGGLGSRSRRGFGTVALQSWESDWTEMNTLASAHGAGSPEEWLNKFGSGFKQLKEWFPGDGSPDHTVLGAGRDFYLFTAGHGGESRQCTDRNGQTKAYDYFAWEMAMDVAGKTMQQFRQRYLLTDQNKDYFRIKAHLCEKNNLTASGVTPALLSGSAPERVAFGLPLTFRYSSLQNVRITFQGTTHDRSASPLWIRIVEINGKCHPFFALLNARLLAQGEKVADQKDVQTAKRNNRPVSPSYNAPANTILQTFCSKELEPNALEVRW